MLEIKEQQLIKHLHLLPPSLCSAYRVIRYYNGVYLVRYGSYMVGLARVVKVWKLLCMKIQVQGKQVDFCAISSIGQGYKWHGQTCWRLGDGVAVVLVQV